jgi:serine/threonine-protein phosphatase 2B catalytic subunit
LNLKDPITIVGDIHSQFYDLCKLIKIGGNPNKTNYLFLGDLVDRGNFGIEVLIFLMCIKIRYKNNINLLRGNHECRQLSNIFNFRSECLKKFDSEVYSLFMEMFDSLPLGAIVNGKFLAVHGGISPDLKTLSQLNKIDRFKEIPKKGLFW